MPKSDKPGSEFSRDREFKVILEDIQSQFRTFGEGLQDVRAGVNRVEKHLDQIEVRVERLETEVAGMRVDVRTMKSSMDRFFVTLSDHETRITTLEKAS